MVTVHFQETPPTMVVLILLLITAYAVYSGIEVLARTAAIFIFPILIPIAGVLLLSLIKMDYPLPALLEQYLLVFGRAFHYSGVDGAWWLS